MFIDGEWEDKVIIVWCDEVNDVYGIIMYRIFNFVWGR